MKGFEDKRNLRALTFDAAGMRDGLPAERVRHVTHDEIPGATRKNLEECSWVTG